MSARLDCPVLREARLAAGLPTYEYEQAGGVTEWPPKSRRKHSRFGNIHCPICAPCRCSKAP